MDHRLCAALGIICLALEGAGCASRAHKHRRVHRHRQVVLLPLPRQTGSNLDRRIAVDDESGFEPMREPASKHPSKKRVKTKGTELEKPKRAEPEKREETSAQPDRFR